jgi:hypothetical protein
VLSLSCQVYFSDLDFEFILWQNSLSGREGQPQLERIPNYLIATLFGLENAVSKSSSYVGSGEISYLILLSHYSIIDISDGETPWKLPEANHLIFLFDCSTRCAL